MFQDQTKQTVFEYVQVCVMLFTHLQEMSQTRVCENHLPDSLRGVFSRVDLNLDDCKYIWEMALMNLFKAE